MMLEARLTDGPEYSTVMEQQRECELCGDGYWPEDSAEWTPEMCGPCGAITHFCACGIMIPANVDECLDCCFGPAAEGTS